MNYKVGFTSLSYVDVKHHLALQRSYGRLAQLAQRSSVQGHTQPKPLIYLNYNGSKQTDCLDKNSFIYFPQSQQ
jgi:hypothetical protein